MTTIAWDGKTLAVDRAQWKDNYVWIEVCKLFDYGALSSSAPLANFAHDRVRHRFRAGHSRIVWAATGDANECLMIDRWIRDGGDLPSLANPGQSYGLVVVQRLLGPPEVYQLTSAMLLGRVYSAPFADGGGFQLALGAMLAGASAVRAIELTAERSGWAAGGVDSVTFE